MRYFAACLPFVGTSEAVLAWSEHLQVQPCHFGVASAPNMAECNFTFKHQTTMTSMRRLACGISTIVSKTADKMQTAGDGLPTRSLASASNSYCEWTWHRWLFGSPPYCRCVVYDMSALPWYRLLLCRDQPKLQHLKGWTCSNCTTERIS